MRLKLRSAALVPLFLLNLATLYAEPVLRGYFIENLPKSLLGKPLAAGKSLVLAHVLNTNSKAIEPGKYQIGVEIENAGKTRKYVLSPKNAVEAGSIKTFRMAIPVSGDEKMNACFRVFGIIGGKTIWSQKRSFLEGAHRDSENNLRSLYVEAEPEPEATSPCEEIPFENEKTAKKIAAQEKAAEVKFAKTTTQTHVKGTTKNAKAPPKIAITRKIDMSEFKKLRTIDEELIVYVVKAGDTLKSIAQKYYGNASKERKIADLNFIEKTSSIRVGEEIIIDVKPLGKEETQTTMSTSDYQPQNTHAEEKRTHKIKKGDTIEKIAKTYLGSSGKAAINSILNANPAVNPTKLCVGDVIVIPDKGGNA